LLTKKMREAKNAFEHSVSGGDTIGGG
jgi:hypothetical protein